LKKEFSTKLLHYIPILEVVHKGAIKANTLDLWKGSKIIGRYFWKVYLEKHKYFMVFLDILEGRQGIETFLVIPFACNLIIA